MMAIKKKIDGIDLKGALAMTKQSSFSLIRHPISLVAYALSLVFGALATYNPNDWPWWPYVAASLAVASVIGGLWLAHNKLKETKKNKSFLHPSSSKYQSTKGNQSPIINETEGNVNLNYESRPKGKKSES